MSSPAMPTTYCTAARVLPSSTRRPRRLRVLGSRRCCAKGSAGDLSPSSSPAARADRAVRPIDAHRYFSYDGPVDVREDQLRLIADATRLRIVRFLAAPIQSCCVREDGVCACDLESHLGLSQPTVSHHMRLLEGVGLVRADRRGRWVYYELETDALRALATGLTA